MTNIEAIKALKIGVELIEYKWEKEKCLRQQICIIRISAESIQISMQQML